MKEQNEDKEYIYIANTNSNQIYYCSKCDRYIIYMQGENKNFHQICANCKYSYLQNIFVDEAKIYFNPKTSIKTNKFIGKDNLTLEIRHYSMKFMNNIDIYENHE